MEIKFNRVETAGKFLNFFADEGIVLGFSELGCTLRDVRTYFNPDKMYQLKQVHSNTIFFSDRIDAGSIGDGIVLGQANRMAIIKTADCVPLSFWSTDYTAAGILHVGWQGLYKGIEKKLLEFPDIKTVNLKNLRFFLGPAIEKKCYEVGKDLFDLFYKKTGRQDIFSLNKNGKFLMDIKQGITHSLKELGIRDDQVFSTGLCTYCEKERFPSYRRDGKTGRRIYNFLYLKPKAN